MADSFHATYKDVMRALQDIQDNLASQDSPGIDAATIGEQQKELEVGIINCFCFIGIVFVIVCFVDDRHCLLFIPY